VQNALKSRNPFRALVVNKLWRARDYRKKGGSGKKGSTCIGHKVIVISLLEQIGRQLFAVCQIFESAIQRVRCGSGSDFEPHFVYGHGLASVRIGRKTQRHRPPIWNMKSNFFKNRLEIIWLKVFKKILFQLVKE